MVHAFYSQVFQAYQSINRKEHGQMDTSGSANNTWSWSYSWYRENSQTENWNNLSHGVEFSRNPGSQPPSSYVWCAYGGRGGSDHTSISSPTQLQHVIMIMHDLHNIFLWLQISRRALIGCYSSVVVNFDYDHLHVHNLCILDMY